MSLMAALGTLGARLAAHLLPEESSPARAVASFALAVAVAVVSATLLGHAGLLTPVHFEVLVAAAVLSSAVWGRSPSPPRRHISDTASFFDLLPPALLCFVTLAWIHHHRYLAPGKFAYDDLSYHLSAVATWLHSHDLRMIKFSLGDRGTTFYPIGGELWAWVLIAPFRDSDFLARWAQLPFAGFSLVATAAIARRLGVSWPATWLAVVTYWSVPRAFPELALSAGNDHSLAFFTLAGVHAALVLAARADRRRAAYFGIVLGLLLGTKYIAVLIAPLLALVWWAARASSPGPTGGFRRALTHAALVAAMAALVGGHTYLRTALATDNPLYPMPVSLLGLNLLPGLEGADVAARRGPGSLGHAWTVLWSRTDLLGPLFRWLVLPGVCCAAVTALWNAWGDRRARLVSAITLLPFGIFGVFVYLHDHRDARYILAGLALAGVAIAWFVDQLPDPVARRAARAASLLFAAVALIHGPPGLVLKTAAAALLVSAGWVLLRPCLPQSTPAGGLVAIACAVAVVIGVSPTLSGYQRRRPWLFPAAHVLEEMAGMAGTAPQVFAYTGSNRPYPFFGSRLQHRVEIVPSGVLERRYFDWGGDAVFPYGGRFPRWWQNLRALGVSYVVVDQIQDAHERRWLVRHPERFERVYGAGNIEIWSVERDTPPAP